MITNKLFQWLVVLGLSLPIAGRSQGTDPATTLWYSASATKWDQALPVGNGRLGAMIFGGVNEERLQLNESTYWTGGPYATVVKGGSNKLPDIQKLVFEGKYLEAHNLFGRYLMGYPVEQQKYQSLANLHLFFDHPSPATNYRRLLDLNTSLATVRYEVNGITYTREVIASLPDQTIAVRLTSSAPGRISFKANLRGVRNQAHSNYATDYFRMDPVGVDGLTVRGKSADYMGVEGKLKYEARIKVKTEGGTVRTNGVDLIVDGANVATIYFVAATNFVNYKDVSANEQQRVERDLGAVEKLSFDQIMHNATQDYQNLFDRVSIKLPVVPNAALPTDQRMEKIQQAPDPSLAALSFNFGRYLLIASSRAGYQPANLQGIWNDDTNPAWDSKYTTNINTEMNYWPAESANLPECAAPLFQFIQELSDQGAAVAREHYGASGWVFHQNTDLWRVAAPMDGPSWGTFTVGGAWLCTHLWEHYAYTRDQEFLKQYLPLMEGSVRFFVDFLVPHPNGKWLVTNPSTSPENFPDGGGNKRYFDEVTGSFLDGTTICAGSTIDMQILYDLFGYYLKALDELHISSALAAKVRAMRERLVPPQIGADGSLQEWADDWKSLEKNHRHFSHLYGLYPGKILSDKRTPALVEACKKVLEERGDGATGWSRAWKMALWARLYDGNRANKIYKGYLKEQSCKQLFALCGRAPQVDGTFGVTAAITEMLMQSHEGFIRLLPALPDEWDAGELKGIRARDGFELNLEWKEKTLVSADILSKAGAQCRILGNVTVTHSGKKVVTKKQNGITEFETQKGERYLVRVKR